VAQWHAADGNAGEVVIAKINTTPQRLGTRSTTCPTVAAEPTLVSLKATTHWIAEARRTAADRSRRSILRGGLGLAAPAGLEVNDGPSDADDHEGNSKYQSKNESIP
jgi:hypothetical protein